MWIFYFERSKGTWTLAVHVDKMVKVRKGDGRRDKLRFAAGEAVCRQNPGDSLSAMD
jgi:hypothetical protein